MIEKINNYFDVMKNCIDNLDRTELEVFINTLLKARDNGHKIFTMGNGGSAAAASHFCCDFNKGMSYGQDKKFQMICLNDNVATMTAYANDVSYDNIFVEQLKNFLQKDDVVIGISGSGNSKNVLNAIEYANKIGAITIGLTGYNGGKLKEVSQLSVNANIDDMQVTEDIHMMICHMIYSILMNGNASFGLKELVNG
ncbi:SIS domain-containing protein [bacterium]|nr:SIS domain-containing protein [bacterium]